ncbi:hypothetical protein PENTCL1PPCAC_15349 [Pristionchus entomophagus]|uniref:ShKT domain-containing protein n=1 Tax=Pristionchus entomophagus TaxID=358040 RepID=A0AAV5TGB4_9BILA|nr:hypothetical protein PENTCL1PPCAC_15349 [Pristionchus entomophagus]
MMITVCLLTLSSLIAVVNGQCGAADNARCPTWVQGGFCASTFYTLDYRKATCGSVCNLCPTTAAASCVGTTENANCATWKTNGFCNNAGYTDAMKRQYCCRTCFTPVTTTPNPTTTCGVIYEGTTELVNSAPTTGVTPLNANTVGGLTKVFVKTGCALKMYTDPMGMGAASGSPFVGADSFVNLAGDATSSISFECTCP